MQVPHHDRLPRCCRKLKAPGRPDKTVYDAPRLKLRPNVQWSDGKPFTSADVVFTLNLIRDHPAIDYSGLWTVITSVSAPDDHTVIVKLKQPSVPILWYLGG